MKLSEAYWPTPEKHEIESGGGGMFTTASDYARFLRAFLKGQLVKEETMKQMQTPQLNETQVKLFQAIAFHPLVHNTFAPEFRPGTKITHGLGGMLNTEDVPGKRKAGSIAWSGILNSRWVSSCCQFINESFSKSALTFSSSCHCSGPIQRLALQAFLSSMFGQMAIPLQPSCMTSWSLQYTGTCWGRRQPGVAFNASENRLGLEEPVQGPSICSEHICSRLGIHLFSQLTKYPPLLSNFFDKQNLDVDLGPLL
jgi:hypothetical protein